MAQNPVCSQSVLVCHKALFLDHYYSLSLLMEWKVLQFFNSTVVLYADDMVLYRTIQTHEDYSLIQMDIDAVTTWIENLSLKFNQEKCKLMLFSRKGTAQLPIIKLNGCSLEKVSEFKYLGVHLTSDLSWSTHVTKVCSKARKCLGMLYRKILIHSDMYTCRVLYTTFLRPHLEYICLPSMGPTFTKRYRGFGRCPEICTKSLLQEMD